MFTPVIRDLHLEVTSRCTLACPRCPRTMHPGQFQQGDIPIDVLRRTIRRAVFPDVRYIMLSGNYGDPIYHPRFHALIAHLKAEGFALRINTNGSYRPRRWWERLAPLLGRWDHVILSIDGLEDTNHLYRVNSRWSDVMTAAEVLRGRCYLVWKLIVFRHNQAQIEAAQREAAARGFNEFKLVRSDRFGRYYTGEDGPDPLQPEGDWLSDRLAVTKLKAAAGG